MFFTFLLTLNLALVIILLFYYIDKIASKMCIIYKIFPWNDFDIFYNLCLSVSSQTFIRIATHSTPCYNCDVTVANVFIGNLEIKSQWTRLKFCEIARALKSDLLYIFFQRNCNCGNTYWFINMSQINTVKSYRKTVDLWWLIFGINVGVGVLWSKY